MMGETKDGRIGQMTENRGGIRGKQVQDRSDRRNEQLGQKLAEETVLRPCFVPQVSGMRLVMGAILTWNVCQEVLVMMMKGRDEYDRQQDRQQDES